MKMRATTTMEIMSKEKLLNFNLKFKKCLKVLRKYDWLLDSYVLDFYVDNHWSKLSPSWCKQLEQIPLEHFSVLLEHSSTKQNHVWPLELLALRKVLPELCLERKLDEKIATLPSCLLLKHHKLKHTFMKCVKPKKRHEIQRMASICASSYRQWNVDFVVDFGAGLGHLARVLGYGYGIAVCCLEMQGDLNSQAELIDEQLETFSAKWLDPSEMIDFKRPKHLTMQLSTSTQPKDFFNRIKNAMQLDRDDFSFGIIGLHPCGDLGATLIRMFLECPEAKFINFVGCCYQKLSTTQTQPLASIHGYPMSDCLKQEKLLNAKLSYEAREISCHATELYFDRLINSDYEHLKVHSFRAASERIIVQHFPHLKHSGLRSVKHVPGMSFEEYFYKAIEGSPIYLDRIHLQNPATENDLLHWRRIVIFYTLRLMLAPLVENIILYDRVLFLLENGCQVDINAIFDPRLSPRNHITCAVKS